MSATVTIAKDIFSGRIFHIDNVDKIVKSEFECCECKQKLSPVKTEARKKDWHFRHQNLSDIQKCRSTALHNFAVQIIKEHTEISVSKALKIVYSDPKTEVTLFGKRSDVTVKYSNVDVHFEVFVTHDIGKDKIDIYKTNKVKCVKIDLSDSGLLIASPNKIKEAVLDDYKNKSIIYWQDDEFKPYLVKETGFSLKYILIVIGVFIGLKFLFNLFKRNRN